MAESRSTWRCICGREWSLSSRHCHADECEEPRRLIEDEGALPVAALHKCADGKDK